MFSSKSLIKLIVVLGLCLEIGSVTGCNEKKEVLQSETELNVLGSANINDTTNTDVTDGMDITDEEVKALAEKFLTLVTTPKYCSYEGLLYELGYSDTKVQEARAKSDCDRIGDCINTMLSYEEFKEKMDEYMTDEVFQKFFSEYFKEKNGYLYGTITGCTGCGYENIEVKKISFNGEKYVYLVTADEIDGTYDEIIYQCVLELVKGEKGKYIVSDYYGGTSEIYKEAKDARLQYLSVEFNAGYGSVVYGSVYEDMPIKEDISSRHIFLGVGDTWQLETRVNGTVNYNRLKLSIKGDENVISISNTGSVTAKANGQASVIVESEGWVIEIPVEVSEDGFFKSRLAQYTFKNVEDIAIDDFDNDGKKEAFIFTANARYDKYEERNKYNGEVWFVNEDKVERLTKDEQIIAYKDFIKVISVGNDKIIKVDSHHPTSSISFIWNVKDGTPNVILDGKFYLQVNEDGTLYVESSAYDADYDGKIWTGHTWKPYYFYMDNGIKEYGAIEIKLEDFLKFDGAKEVIDKIVNNGNEIINILYRKNNIININYFKKANERTYSYGNSTIEYNETSVKIIGGEGGTYKAALLPEVAVYPDKFIEP